MKYRIKCVKPGVCYHLIHPDGYWIGPGLGNFRSVAEAIDWLHGVHLARLKRWKA